MRFAYKRRIWMESWPLLMNGNSKKPKDTRDHIEELHTGKGVQIEESHEKRTFLEEFRTSGM